MTNAALHKYYLLEFLVDGRVGKCSVQDLFQILNPCMREFYMAYRKIKDVDCLYVCIYPLYTSLHLNVDGLYFSLLATLSQSRGNKLLGILCTLSWKLYYFHRNILFAE